MSWQATRYRPPIHNPKGRVAISANAPFSRFTGCIAFCLTGFVAAKVAERLLGLSPGFLDAKWGMRETIVVGVVLLVSMLGGLIGFGLGIQVSVKNNYLTRLISILWHFFADGQIVCFLLFSLLVGKERRSPLPSQSLRVFAILAAASLLAGLVLFIAGQFKEKAGPRPVLWAVIVVPPTIAASLWVRNILHLQPSAAVLFGVVAGLANVFLSARMIQRDYQQMREVNELVKSP